MGHSRRGPVGADAIDMTVQVADGTKKKDVASFVRNALAAQLPEEAYKISVSGGDKGRIERRKGAAEFSLLQVSSTIDKVKFAIKAR
jgi:hypothetical protein